MKDRKQNIRYLGFESTDDGRRFDFSITGVRSRVDTSFSNHSRALMFTGANKITFQESAKICYEKLRVLIRARANRRARCEFMLTGDDIAQFRHIPRGRPAPRKN